MKKLFQVIFVVVFLAISHHAMANMYFVDQNHPQASDDNPGTELLPFETVQKGLNALASGDTVFIKIGNYEMAGFSKDLPHPVSILGEDKDSTVLDSIGTLNIFGGPASDIFTLKNVKFTNYVSSIFNLVVAEGDTLDGIHISDCIFGEVERTSKTRTFLGRYDVSPAGYLTNINISNCDFLGLKAPGVKYIYIYEGIISNINITNNNFHNLVSTSETRGAIAVNVGTNSNLQVNKNILVSGNCMDTIVAATDGEIETHGILVYGDSMRILDNTVRYMVPGTDHEAIYMKGNYSVIANNVMIDCTSKQGAIAIKGTGKSFHDTIRDNRTQSNQEGKGYYTAGAESIIMENNYLKNTDSTSIDGLYIYAANSSFCYQKNNYSQTGGNGAYMNDVGGGWITGNTLISYNALPHKLTGTTGNVYVAGNMEYSGWPVQPPTAMATADIIEGVAPLTVNFSGSGSFDPNGVLNDFEWNFHDGSIATETNPNHIFTEARTYGVTLIVTDAAGFKDMAYVLIRVHKAEEIPVTINEIVRNTTDLSLHIYPNPFDHATNITFDLSGHALVNIDVFDIQGRMVRSLFSGDLTSGKHRMSWDGRNEEGKVLPGGIYLVRCRAGCAVQSTRVLLL